MLKEIPEKDWKLFKAKLIVWQESYMDKLNHEYIEILSSSENASEKFWELEKRIKQDKRSTGVICEVKRSNLIENILSLINEGVICFYDLSEFSDNLQATFKLMLEIMQGEKSAEEDGWIK